MFDFYGDNYLSDISVDCVVFGFHLDEIKVLLLKFKGSEIYGLPGGFIKMDMDMDDAARVVLKQRTGLTDIFLSQFHIFGKTNRNDNVDHITGLTEAKVFSEEMRPLFEKRFVSVGYFALVDIGKAELGEPDMVTDSSAWWPLSQLPFLALDHAEIVQKAHENLMLLVNQQPIGLNLLPQYFTMSEIQTLYEKILCKNFDRRNFHRKIIAIDVLVKTEMVRKGGAFKSPALYRFDKVKYKKATREGLVFNW